MHWVPGVAPEGEELRQHLGGLLHGVVVSDGPIIIEATIRVRSLMTCQIDKHESNLQMSFHEGSKKEGKLILLG